MKKFEKKRKKEKWIEDVSLTHAVLFLVKIGKDSDVPRIYWFPMVYKKKVTRRSKAKRETIRIYIPTDERTEGQTLF